MRTYFQGFTRDNGLPIMVEVGVDGSYSPTTYSPMFGAEGGDAATFYILDSWPDTPFHNCLVRIEMSIRWPQRRDLTPFGWWLADLISKPVRALLWFDAWWRASLTDAERERMEAWLAEHYVDDDDYEPEWGA